MDKPLLFKYLKGTTSLEETKLVEEWILQSKENRSYFNKIKTDFTINTFENTSKKVSVDKSYHDFESKYIKPKVFRSRYYVSVLKYAAIFLILLTSSFFIYNSVNKNQNTLLVNDLKEPRAFNLPDGSKVTLNSQSELSYNEEFNKTLRNVNLKGEAYFKVAKNKQKPFIVNTGSLSTQVMGTQFNVKETDATIDVTVSEGAVKVFFETDTVNLKPNRQAIFNRATKGLEAITVKAFLYDVWLRENIELNDVTLEELGIVLQSLYSYKIISSDKSIYKARMSIAFNKNEGIQKVLERINYVNELQLTLKPNYMIEAKVK